MLLLLLLLRCRAAIPTLFSILFHLLLSIAVAAPSPTEMLVPNPRSRSRIPKTGEPCLLVNDAPGQAIDFPS